MLAFTPIAFLVLIGVVEGVSPSMEEAAQTLRADAWTTFTTVSLPLMRPGLANAFLLGFIESLADFGNPLVLGGNFDVLSTEIFFAVVGAQHDQGRAAMLAIDPARLHAGRLLGAAALARAQAATPRSPARATPACHCGCRGGAGAVLRRGAALGGADRDHLRRDHLRRASSKSWGRDHTPTLRHYVHAFGVTAGEHGLVWSGTAWNCFWTTLQIALVAALLTAAIGLLTAWLLVRQEFGFKRSFEFGTMLSFAIPGTVIGVAYVLAFNVPPIELTGTGIILVIAFIFRNMPVGVRAGIATMSQLDRSLDEASLTLRAGNLTTVRRVILPLLRPAILAALVYSFVRAMTAISAVIFLVSAHYDMATTYILGRVENGDYGLAIAYSSVLILVMLAVIGLLPARGRRAPARPPRRARRCRRRGSRHERAVERPLRAGQQGLWQRGRRARGLVRDRGRSSRDAARPLGLRQDHDAAHDRRAGAADLGADPDRRRRTSPTCRRPRATSPWCSSPTRCSRT